VSVGALLGDDDLRHRGEVADHVDEGLAVHHDGANDLRSISPLLGDSVSPKKTSLAAPLTKSTMGRPHTSSYEVAKRCGLKDGRSKRQTVFVLYIA
jgi:hypothetical protein